MLNVKQQRGMFGSPMIQSGEIPQMQQQMPQQPPQQKQRWLQGGKFTAKDAIGLALGAIGDAFSGQPTTANMITGARQAQQNAQAAQAQRQQEWDDWVRRQEYARANPMPTTLESNVAAWQRLSPEQRAAYGQMQEAQQGPVTVTLPGDRLYSGPRSGLADALRGQAPSSPVGKLTPITMQNTPAPQVGASGFPASLTPAQYQATVAQMGKDKTDAWMARNGIRMGM